MEIKSALLIVIVLIIIIAIATTVAGLLRKNMRETENLDMNIFTDDE